MGARKRDECAEEDRHKARRIAESDVEMWVLGYAQAHGLSELDMLGVLNHVTRGMLRAVDRDDEQQRTGFRHRLAGE